MLRFSHVQLCVILWTVAHQAPLSMGFSRQEYWSGLPFSSPGDLPDPGIEPATLMSPALAGGFFTTRATWEASSTMYNCALVGVLEGPGQSHTERLLCTVQPPEMWNVGDVVLAFRKSQVVRPRSSTGSSVGQTWRIPALRIPE